MDPHVSPRVAKREVEAEDAGVDMVRDGGASTLTVQDLEDQVEEVSRLLAREGDMMLDLRIQAQGRRTGESLEDLVVASRQRNEASLTFLTASNERDFDVSQKREQYPNFQHEVRLRRAEQVRKEASEEQHRNRRKAAGWKRGAVSGKENGGGVAACGGAGCPGPEGLASGNQRHVSLRSGRRAELLTSGGSRAAPAGSSACGSLARRSRRLAASGSSSLVGRNL